VSSEYFFNSAFSDSKPAGWLITAPVSQAWPQLVINSCVVLPVSSATNRSSLALLQLDDLGGQSGFVSVDCVQSGGEYKAGKRQRGDQFVHQFSSIDGIAARVFNIGSNAGVCFVQVASFSTMRCRSSSLRALSRPISVTFRGGSISRISLTRGAPQYPPRR
jgi:hypothetical protein